MHPVSIYGIPIICGYLWMIIMIQGYLYEGFHSHGGTPKRLAGLLVENTKWMKTFGVPLF